jgi:hypothetical protein
MIGFVVPAKAGTQRLFPAPKQRHWVPAFAGMTSFDANKKGGRSRPVYLLKLVTYCVWIGR